MESVASGGKVVIVGMGQPVCSLNTDAAIVKELDIHGSYRYTNTVRRCPFALVPTCNQTLASSWLLPARLLHG